MGKRRKSAGKPHTTSTSGDVDPSNSKLRIKTYEDVADSEDEFHINRDKILLEEGPARKRQRKQKEDDALLEPSDEEVLAYGLSEGDLEEDDDDESQSTDKSGKGASRLDSQTRRARSESSQIQEDVEDADGWGPSKRDYYSANVIETETDALEEEEEAIRLQRKQLQGMTEADFGFDGGQWLEAGKADAGRSDDDYDGTVQEVLPQFSITDNMGPEERTKALTVRYPEFEPLAQELLSLRIVYEKLLVNITDTNEVEDHSTLSKGTPKVRLHAEDASFSAIKRSALAAYLAALSMYFALFTSGIDDNGRPAPKASLQLRDHPVMETLVQCRSLWERVKGLEVSGIIEYYDTSTAIVDTALDSDGKTMMDCDTGNPEFKEGATVKHKKRRRSQAQRAAEAPMSEARHERSERLQRTEEDLAKLSTITTAFTKKPVPSSDVRKVTRLIDDGGDSDFGEETTLTAEEVAEKARRKKSLRFYTSQIVQKSNKRDLAGRDAGGDADLPYRERFRDRVLRLSNEVEAKGKNKRVDQNGDTLGGESDEDDRRMAKEVRGDGGDNEYYDFVTARFQEKKATKASLSVAREAAAKEGGVVREIETIGSDGKRGITYAIEKNKGLTPKRKKDVRNPRVKKRKKYEDKKKKLSSVRAVYKGGEGRGGYGGEMTGIKKGLIRSVKL